MKVHIVEGVVNYESSIVLGAFEEKGDAEAFAESCREFDRKCPMCPALNAPDEEWNKWERKNKSWNNRHPAGIYSNRDSYNVVTITVRRKKGLPVVTIKGF
jgi:hypothetical protein